MKKEDKEKLIFQTRLKEIESIDRDMTSFEFKLYVAWAAVFAYFFKIGLNDSNVWILAISLIVILLLQFQSYRYITDCYNWLVLAIRENKLFIESTPLSKASDIIFYKRKYSL